MKSLYYFTNESFLMLVSGHSSNPPRFLSQHCKDRNSIRQTAKHQSSKLSRKKLHLTFASNQYFRFLQLRKIESQNYKIICLFKHLWIFHLNLTSPSVMSAFFLASALMNRSLCVMVAGCSVSDSTPPRDTASWITRTFWGINTEQLT